MNTENVRPDRDLTAIAGIIGDNPIVFSDVDKTIRWHKSFILPANTSAISKFQKDGCLFIPITGAPRHHIPEFLISPFGLCESGAVKLLGQEIEIIAPPEEVLELELLKITLGIKTQDGPCVILGKYPVLVEGPRQASFTLITGSHPLYPDAKIYTPMREIKNLISKVIAELSLSLLTEVGTAENYSWFDVTTSFKKEHAVLWFMRETGLSQIYFMGDGINDREAMRLPGVIPIGFKNSVPEIKQIVAERDGILISKNGPDGGVAEALKIVMSQEAD